VLAWFLAEWTRTTVAKAALPPHQGGQAEAAVDVLHALATTGFRVALHAHHVGFAVGFSGRGQQDLKARQALGFALELQVRNFEQANGVQCRTTAARNVRAPMAQGSLEANCLDKV
jgi:hypothetical protein